MKNEKILDVIAGIIFVLGFGAMIAIMLYQTFVDKMPLF